jgi:hypothetical protein
LQFYPFPRGTSLEHQLQLQMRQQGEAASTLWVLDINILVLN